MLSTRDSAINSNRNGDSRGSPIPILNPSPSKPLPRSSYLARDIDTRHNHHHLGHDHGHGHGHGHGQQQRSHSVNPVMTRESSPQRALFRDGSTTLSLSAASSSTLADSGESQRLPSATTAAAASSASLSSSSSSSLVKVPMTRVESLPNLTQLHLKSTSDWSSVVIPQPRKALLCPSSMFLPGAVSHRG
jgi:hypothetical protein